VLGAVDAVDPDALGPAVVHDLDGVTIQDSDDAAGEFGAIRRQTGNDKQQFKSGQEW